MFASGFTTLFRVGRIPVRAHWSILIGFLVVSGLRFAPGAWLGYLAIVLCHELGHTALARAYRAHVYTIDIHGFGGYCVHEAVRTNLAASVIAWGGVLAQLVLAGAAVGLAEVWPVSGPHASEFYYVLTRTNLFIAALNLVPFPGLDGALALGLPVHAYRALRRRTTRRAPKAAPRRRAPKRDDGLPNLRLVRDDKGDFKFENDDD